MTDLLNVQDLSIGFGDAPPVVDGVSFRVRAGSTLALVGESGSGKTLTCRAILRILPEAAQIRSGQVLFADQPEKDLLTLPPRAIRRIRGGAISMVFQEPMRALSPLHRIGNQVSEVLALHREAATGNPRTLVLEMFERVGIKHPERIYNAYPFELSGGLRQRAMIAMAMVSRPRLLIADEPTTALDVTTQAMVLGLIKDLQAETEMSVILVTHDLGVVANMADDVVVMRKGRVMEAGTAIDVLADPAHAYTQRLFHAAPMIPEDPDILPRTARRDPILEMRNVSKSFQIRGGGWFAPKQILRACDDINLTVERGKTMAIVGESGSGKTTCARIALAAIAPDPGGEIWFRPRGATTAKAVHDLSTAERMAFKRQAQMVFQDPYSSLSPRMRIQEALTEPLEIHGIGTTAERKEIAADRLSWVGLDPDMLKRFPHAFSGGQRQRLSIARALTLDPELVVCDEPTSALDVSVQEQILELLEQVQERTGISYLFISHDLAVVSRIADDVAVMRQGMVVEQAPPDMLFSDPRHPYTKALIAAQPEPDIGRPINLKLVAEGAGSPASWPQAFRIEGASVPDLIELDPGHKVRCYA